MEIDKLISILQTARTVYGATSVKILRYADSFDCDYIAEDIAGYSYSSNDDFVILFPEYI